MALSRVDPNRKQAKSLIDQVEEDPFCIDRMAKTVSAPSQASVHLAKRTSQDLYYEGMLAVDNISHLNTVIFSNIPWDHSLEMQYNGLYND
jgi:hypothetical protein